MIEQKNIDILVVEDNTHQIEFLSFLLNKIGIRDIQTATNYEEAIQHCNTSLPDIALIDIILPNSKSGIEVAKFIKQQNTAIPIIFITRNLSLIHI